MQKTEILIEYVPVFKKQLDRYGIKYANSFEDIITTYHDKIIVNWEAINSNKNSDLGFLSGVSPTNRGVFNRFESQYKNRTFSDVVDTTVKFISEVYQKGKINGAETKEQSEIIEEAERDTSGNVEKGEEKENEKSSFFNDNKAAIISIAFFFLMVKLLSNE